MLPAARAVSHDVQLHSEAARLAGGSAAPGAEGAIGAECRAAVWVALQRWGGGGSLAASAWGGRVLVSTSLAPPAQAVITPVAVQIHLRMLPLQV